MILGQDFIFIAIPKVASSSLSKAIEQNPHKCSHDPYRGKYTECVKTFGNSHIPLSMISNCVDLSNHYKFCFVRNPYDRFISFCAWTKIFFVEQSSGEKYSFEKNPTKFMGLILHNEEQIRKQTTAVWSQFEFGTDEMQFVGRYESLQDDYDTLSKKLGFKKTRLSHSNKSSHGDYRSYYTTSLVEKVTKFYKTDINKFGYKFE